MLKNFTANEDWEFVRNTTEKYRPPFGTFETAFTSGVLFPLALFGIIANVITIIVVYRSPNLRTIFNYYIMSLCVSDFSSAFLSPLWIYRRIWGYDFENWKIPYFFCKVYWIGDITTSISTSFHIAAFSGLRFLSIAKPHVFNRISLAHAKKSILFIWLLSVCFGSVPYAIFMGMEKKNRYSTHQSKGWPACSSLLSWANVFNDYNVYGNIFLFYIPFALIFLQSLATSIVICARRSRRNKAGKNRANRRRDDGERHRQMKENLAISQLALIVGSFAIGYLPTTIFLSIVTYLPSATYGDRKFIWWFGAMSFICLRVSECLNPIFYNLASTKLRTETKKFIRLVCACKKSNNGAERPANTLNTVSSR